MKKQIILSSLFLVFGLFSSPIQAANLDDLEICPDPNLRSQVSDSSPSSKINPLPTVENGETLPENEALKEGYSCKVATMKTRPGFNGGYEGGGYVQWTLVKKEDDKETWAAHTDWGLIYVGDVEDGTYRFRDANFLCRDKKLVINGEKITMTLPEVSYGRVGSSTKKPPLNFELLMHLNYESVVPNRYYQEVWLWMNRNYHVYRPSYNDNASIGILNSRQSVRCVGRDTTEEREAREKQCRAEAELEPNPDNPQCVVEQIRKKTHCLNEVERNKSLSEQERIEQNTDCISKYSTDYCLHALKRARLLCCLNQD